MAIAGLLVAVTCPAQYLGGTGGGGATNCSAAFAMLPVELLHFTAKVDGEHVVLSWATASELNNAGFHVERSRDGERFDAIVEAEGMGTTQQLTHYEAMDHAPLPGLSLYRLRQTDFDGTTTWSDAVAVEWKESTWTAYPNPVQSMLTLRGTSDTGPLHADVFDSLGQWVLQQVLTEGQSMIDMNQLPTGLYRVRLAWDRGAEILTVVKE